MKRFLAIAFTALAAVACGTDNRGSYLKVYNWGDYIDEALIPEFEQWYEEQTGEKVEIIYQTFDINETMLSKIEKGHEDYDVVCPSDYIIERMLREDMLLPIDCDFGDTPNYIGQYISPFIRESLKKVDGAGKDANDYAVGYMWGTTGLLYNEKYVDAADVRSWNAIKDDRYAGKVFVKDASRDIYGPILIYLKQDELKKGKVTLDELMYDSSDGSIAAVEEYMTEMRHRVAGWEADFGKEQMTQERGWLNMTWSGDAVWAIEEAAEVDVPLNYVVPDEGSNIWFDGWVIPKYAKNVKAAKYFINFLCRPDVAIRNMDFIGYVSAVGASEVLEAMQDEKYEETVDVRYFFGDIPGAGAAHLNHVQYPDVSVTGRCTMMHDWGDDTRKLIDMWSRVKGNQLSWWTVFVIAATAAGLIASEIAGALKKSRRKREKAKKSIKKK